MSNPNAPVPPQNLDAEESVLGTLLLSSGAINAAAEVVTAADFYRQSHGLIFQAAVDMDTRGEAVDAITLVDELNKRGQLERVGGKVRVHELATLAPPASNAAHYARIVRETARRRDLIRAGDEIRKLGWEGIGDIDELLVQAERHIGDATSGSYSSSFVSIGDAVDSLYSEIATAVESGKPISGLRTGFPDLDLKTTGFYPGTLIVLAARPKVGKSLLAQNIAENLADRGVPVGIFSLEMSEREMALRSIVRKTKLDMQKLRTGRITTAELGAVQQAAQQFKEKPLYIEDVGSITLPEIRAKAKQLITQHGAEFFIVDYLQLMVSDPNAKTETRTNEVSQITRNLKLLAKELRVPILLLSQLNRNLEYRSDKRPIPADLRDSGSIEQDADLVMFLYREELYTRVEDEKARDAELIISLNRMGAPGTVNLLFLGRRQTFATPAITDHGGSS